MNRIHRTTARSQGPPLDAIAAALEALELEQRPRRSRRPNCSRVARNSTTGGPFTGASTATVISGPSVSNTGNRIESFDADGYGVERVAPDEFVARFPKREA